MKKQTQQNVGDFGLGGFQPLDATPDGRRIAHRKNPYTEMVIGDQRPSVDHSKKTKKNSDIFIFFQKVLNSKTKRKWKNFKRKKYWRMERDLVAAQVLVDELCETC